MNVFKLLEKRTDKETGFSYVDREYKDSYNYNSYLESKDYGGNYLSSIIHDYLELFANSPENKKLTMARKLFDVESDKDYCDIGNLTICAYLLKDLTKFNYDREKESE